jgi:hypothetical protein
MRGRFPLCLSIRGAVEISGLVAFARFARERQDLPALLRIKPSPRLPSWPSHRLLSAFSEQTRELVAIEPAPVRFEAGEKFEFAVCEDQHDDTRKADAKTPD